MLFHFSMHSNKRLLSLLVFLGLLSLGVLSLLTLFSFSAHAGVEAMGAKYRHDVTDLQIKSYGVDTPFVYMKRSYRNKVWRFNRRWVKLLGVRRLGEDHPYAILRNSDKFEPVNDNGTQYRFGNQTLYKTDSGWRWVNRSGDWIEYDDYYYIQRYGDRYGSYIYFSYDTNKHINGVFQEDGKQLLWMVYKDDPKKYLVEEAWDYTGRKVTYHYNEQDQLEKVTDARGYEWHYAYNDQGYLNKITDPNGHYQTINYRQKDEVSSILDENGQGIHYTYTYHRGDNEFYFRQTSAQGKVTERWYSIKNQLLKEVINGMVTFERFKHGSRTDLERDYQQRQTLKTYNEFTQITEIQYPDFGVEKRSYNNHIAELTEMIDANGHITRYEYDEQGRFVGKTRAAGSEVENHITYVPDDDGYKKQKIFDVPETTGESREGDEETPATPITWTYDYDEYGNLNYALAPNGAEERSTHNVRGNTLSYTDERNQLWQYTYDNLGNQLTRTDPLNHTTTYEYDGVGNKTKVIYPDNTHTLYRYDHRNRLIERENALGHIYHYAYDTDDRLSSETTETGVVTHYRYDTFGRLSEIQVGNESEYITPTITKFTYPTQTTENAGRYDQPIEIIYPTFKRTLEYDAMGRVTKQTDEDLIDEDTIAMITSITYDKVGNRLSVTDGNQHNTQYTYDALNRLSTTTDALNNVTQYGYDHRDNLTSLTDANEHTYTFIYNNRNQLTDEISPLGRTQRYDYDLTGNLNLIVDGKGQVTRHFYDVAGRRNFTRYYTDETATDAIQLIEFSYNDRDSLTGYDDGVTSAIYDYDDVQQKTGETVNYGPFTTRYQYTYHADGQKASFTDHEDRYYGYYYDELGRLQSLSIPGLSSISFQDYQWQRATKVLYHPQGNNHQQFTFDGFQRLHEQTFTPEHEDPINFSYHYDAASNLLTKTTDHGTYSYQYDEIDRLTNATNPTLDDETYTYDPLGNRLTDQRTGEALWQYNDDNQLINRQTHRYTYDDNGQRETQINIETDPETLEYTYIYNHANRLTEVKDGNDNTIATYYYDPFGRRLSKTLHNNEAEKKAAQKTSYSEKRKQVALQKRATRLAERQAKDKNATINTTINKKHQTTTEKTASTTEQTFFQYSDEGLIAELDYDGYAKDTYGYKPNSTWGTDPLFKLNEEIYLFNVNDHLGSIQHQYSQLGSTANYMQHDTFWNNTNQLNNSERHRFPGQYHDEETGTYYNYHRDYDPTVGRYMQVDPIGLEGGYNVYSYVGENPVTRLDESGQYWQLPLLFCVRFPRLCKEIINCVKYPPKCKKKFCKAGNRIYKPICNTKRCFLSDSYFTRRTKLALLEGCVFLRESVKYFCFDNKKDKGHDDEIRKAKGKVESCKVLCGG